MATRKKTTRKLRFGSPAWQKKYNPAFGGKKKAKKATKRTAKKVAKLTKRSLSAKTKKVCSQTKMLSTQELRKRGSSPEAKYVGKLAGAWSGCISAKPEQQHLYNLWEIMSVAEAHSTAVKAKGVAAAIKRTMSLIEKASGRY